MSIKIKVRKFITADKKFVKILSINMLTKEKLPAEYLGKGESVAYYTKIKNFIQYNNTDQPLYYPPFLIEGSVYSKKNFNEKLQVIKRCGERLSKINWEKEETITI